MMKQDQKITSQRYYYSTDKSFEQSLDVLKPSVCNKQQPMPLVVLVVGSAWVGHVSIVYAVTSWWNSAAPQNFARQGCVTVCIRHRGSFPRVTNDKQQLLMALVLAALVTGYCCYVSSLDVSDWSIGSSPLVLAMCVVWGWVLLALGAHGAADFDDMVHDVADALTWVQEHRELLRGDATSPQKLVFGGYSSGGHTAATLMQRPELFKARGLPEPEDLFDAALFISGVLAVRPLPIMSGEKEKTSSSTWLTDFVTRVVFGKQGASTLPSPLHTIHKHPRIPHVLFGCIEEVFGLGWLDVFFCSREFCHSLRQYKVPARLVQVNSDHWNILRSSSLKSVLEKELEWIMRQA